MNDNYRLTFQLKQHTPLIHFQHDQDGATLRASEVKPKLDKFLLEEAGGFEKVRAEHKNWFVGDGEKVKAEDLKPALNYKMRFFCKETHVNEIPRYSLYYGNMGAEGNKALFVTGETSLEIICFIPELVSLINENIEGFFICTNFGRMQNKGFGSFTATANNNSGDVVAVLKKYFGAKCVYSFDSADSNDPIRKDTFDRIKNLYSVMKSGYNFREYKRSVLFDFFHKANIGNEKACLKKEKISAVDGKGVPFFTKHPYDPHEEKAQEFKYVRAVLGTGDHVEYKTAFGKNLSVKISNNEIERFPSPVFFKVIGNTVYFMAMQIDERIFEKEFTFKSKNGAKTLKTPKKSEFDLDGFLEYFYNNYDANNRTYGVGGKIKKLGGDGK